MDDVRAVLDGSSRWCCLVGDVRQRLRDVPDGSIQTCVTSPPYYGLRDYGDAAQIGREESPNEYVAALVDVFRDVRRALRDDGTLWLNLGDSYASDSKWGGATGGKHAKGLHGETGVARAKRTSGIPDKNLIGIPWMVAFALRADGWILRSDIVWTKPNPMPEPVEDRPTRAHEYVFLLSKHPRYFYDAAAIREPAVRATVADKRIGTERDRDIAGATRDFGEGTSASRRNATNAVGSKDGRNARSVWTIASQPYDGAHFATMPPELARRCILAGSRKGDVVLDPFGGAATTALVALQHGRRAILCELNPEYIALQRERLAVFDSDAVSPLHVTAPEYGPLFGGTR